MGGKGGGGGLKKKERKEKKQTETALELKNCPRLPSYSAPLVLHVPSLRPRAGSALLLSSPQQTGSGCGSTLLNAASHASLCHGRGGGGRGGEGQDLFKPSPPPPLHRPS